MDVTVLSKTLLIKAVGQILPMVYSLPILATAKGTMTLNT